MQTFYFPVETIDREIDFRILLASRLARAGRRIVIGHAGFLNDAMPHLRNGVYVGKNLFWPHQTKRLDLYHQAKNSDFVVVFLDEEGAVYPGREQDWGKALDSRIDPRALQGDDVICTWGRFQGEHYSKALLGLDSKPEIAVTGHPRFDCYKPELRSYFRDDADALRARFGQFVLVNTNLARANHAEGLSRVFSETSGFPVSDPEARETFIRRWSYYRTMHAEFIRLVHYLSAKLGSTKIVLRPHPSEDVTSYETVFWGLSNVVTVREGPVAPWIIAAQALIHDGCTTAVEAKIADQKIIRYGPVETHGDFADRFLPNSFGSHARTPAEVLALINAEGLAPSSTGAQATDQGTRPEDLLLNLKESSFERLEDVVEKACAGLGDTSPPSEMATLRKLARSFSVVEAAKTPIRLSTKKRRRSFQHARGKFYGFVEGDFARRLDRANQIRGAAAKMSMFTPYLVVVESA